jgi:hypothetical protein
MSITDIIKKIKSFLALIRDHLKISNDLFIILTLILVGLAGFGLGKISALEKSREPIMINKVLNSTSTVKSISEIPMQASVSAKAMIASEKALGFLVASKTGKKYHFPWCVGASQIADKNKIWFDSYIEAQKAGYTKASNCKGLE